MCNSHDQEQAATRNWHWLGIAVATGCDGGCDGYGCRGELLRHDTLLQWVRAGVAAAVVLREVVGSAKPVRVVAVMVMVVVLVMQERVLLLLLLLP